MPRGYDIDAPPPSDRKTRKLPPVDYREKPNSRKRATNNKKPNRKTKDEEEHEESGYASPLTDLSSSEDEDESRVKLKINLKRRTAETLEAGMLPSSDTIKVTTKRRTATSKFIPIRNEVNVESRAATAF